MFPVGGIASRLSLATARRSYFRRCRGPRSGIAFLGQRSSICPGGIPDTGVFPLGDLCPHVVLAPRYVGGHCPARNAENRHRVATGRQSLGAEDSDGLYRFNDARLCDGTAESLLTSRTDRRVGYKLASSKRGSSI